MLLASHNSELTIWNKLQHRICEKTTWRNVQDGTKVTWQKGCTYDNFIFLYAYASATKDLDEKVVKGDTMNLVNSK